MSFAEVVTCPICGGVEGVGMLGPMVVCRRCVQPPACEVCGRSDRDLVVHAGWSVVMCKPCEVAAHLIVLPERPIRRRPRQLRTGPGVELDPDGEQLWRTLLGLKREPTTPFDPRNPWINEGGAA